MSPLVKHLRQETAAPDVQEVNPDVEAQWLAEAVWRMESVDRGEMATISAEDLHAGLPLPDEN